MSNGDSADGGAFGISHLAGMPITLSFGAVLLLVLLVLVVLRVVFADIKVSGGARA